MTKPREPGMSPQLQGMLSALSVGLGVALLLAGWWGESHKIWTERPYLTNMYSGLTAAFFGGPFGVLVLQKVAAGQLLRQQYRSSRQLRLVSLFSFALSLNNFWLVDGVRVEEHVVDVHNRVLAACKNILHAYPVMSDVEALQQLTLTVNAEHDRMQRLMKSRGNAERQWAKLHEDWRYLQDVVKTRTLETGGQWLPPETEAMLARFLGHAIYRFDFFRRWDRSLAKAFDEIDLGWTPATVLNNSENIEDLYEFIITPLFDELAAVERDCAELAAFRQEASMLS